MYPSKPAYVFGFHGCDKTIGRRILNGEEELQHSVNAYDWLGHGVYFWENNYARAKQYAEVASKRKDSSIKEPFVIGAIIDLGYCLDLLDQYWLDFLSKSYQDMEIAWKAQGQDLPRNQKFGANDFDFKKRDLDCAVIRYAHVLAKDQGLPEFDSVRAAFWEGELLYPDAGFKTHNHIQLAIINPACIKGIFLPVIFDSSCEAIVVI